MCASRCDKHCRLRSRHQRKLHAAQAAAFLQAAWAALAARLGRPAAALPVLFEHVAILQAVPLAAGGAAALRVALDARQRFQV